MAKLNRKLWVKTRRWAKQNARVFATAGSVSAVVIGLRLISLLRLFELTALDALLNLRPTEPIDDRVRIVAIDQRDINKYKWPLEDEILAELIEKINAQEPAVIGLDIVRDRPIGRGQVQLEDIIRELPYFVGIEVLHSDPDFRTPALPIMWKEDETGQLKNGVGFNNFPLDADGVVRRNSLYWSVEGETKRSFSLQLAWQYLQIMEGIPPEGYPAEAPKHLKFGSAIFYDLREFYSIYGWLSPDDNYQIISNMRNPDKLRSVSLSEVMNDEVPPGFFRDRVVVIGNISENTKDLFLSPFRKRLGQTVDRIGGVQVHANFTSEILSATLDNRPLLKFFPLWQDAIWICIWAVLGSGVIWRWRSPIRGGAILITCISSILGGSYILLFYIRHHVSPCALPAELNGFSHRRHHVPRPPRKRAQPLKRVFSAHYQQHP
ncbi:putative Chase2 sensor protein [[Leptolyngbya] sp. PCC 7376]|uniref:CHASE2 domain-containing protein n=1 Tax=[Leptolyngbya] sp. PCC 7376 TaxID=111781 RepID=UPI00029F14B6|nr:CHASE2 domain-containing protein [[Leptolyngbya] sp. PCC 7376]AFY36727.1 putative Chase2 sensor protein [[Leptolyngbya] sp. PCC 7376]